MKVIRKPRIGLAAVMCRPFRGDKEGNYRRQSDQLEQLAANLDFELKIITNGIYSADQAESAASQLQEWGADFIILQAASFASGSFIYPFAKLRVRLGLWAVPEGAPTSEGGLPLNSFTAMNLYNSIIRTRIQNYPWPVKWFWGNPGQALFDKRLEITVCALRALVNLRGTRIGLVGGVASGFDNLIIDEASLNDRLGITVQHIEFTRLMSKVTAVDQKQASAVASEIRASATLFDERNTEALQKSGQVNLALAEMAAEEGLDAFAISCWPQFQSDFHFAICSVMGNLNTHGLIAACEGDVASAVSMLMLHYMINGGLVTLMDLATVDPSDESILLWHCGPTSPLLADARGVSMKSLWLFDAPGDIGIGLHNDLVLQPGIVSVMGFNADFNRLLILGGTIDNLKPGYAGSGGWLRSIQLNGESIKTSDLIQTLMVSGFQHHYPLAYTDLSAAGLEICKWLGIEPLFIEPYTSFVK